MTEMPIDTLKEYVVYALPTGNDSNLGSLREKDRTHCNPV